MVFHIFTRTEDVCCGITNRIRLICFHIEINLTPLGNSLDCSCMGREFFSTPEFCHTPDLRPRGRNLYCTVREQRITENPVPRSFYVP